MHHRLASLVPAAALLLLAAGAAGCGGGDGAASAVPHGDADRAPELFETYGCGSCHTIAGVDGADADVGPPLDDFADRLYVAGRLPNTPDNLVRWIMHPQAVAPGTLMPELGVRRRDARDMAAYLYGH